MNKNYFSLFSLLLFFSCQPDFDEPYVSLDEYRIAEGFNLEVVASEPFLEAPVAIDFDDQGRIWTAEMRGYMRDVEGSTENQPTGVISILEDQDGDGVVDHSKVFLDKLVMPRSLALVYGGLLYATPPNLWFVEIENDKPVNKVLVDSVYAVGGNPEHQPNGLMLNIDNWIYNAKSTARYQRKNGQWIKEVSSMKGQWGISKDNYGRLYYNTNSTQLKGDYVLPNLLVRNKYFKPKTGINKSLTSNQKVYPLIVNPVNRGYIPGVLNEDSVLVRVTSACGPLIYRGGQFPNGYDQNAFVCVPEANLLKRNSLEFLDGETKATQVWDNKEFLVSTDPTFRPVNLHNSPSGDMYIVDMHRGVIQHNAFLSPYLKEHIRANSLDTLLGMGRILKVSHKGSKNKPQPRLDQLTASELVSHLKDENGWLRDRAQHYLIYKQQQEAIPELKEMLLDTKAPISQIHALYTLKGLKALTFDLLKEVTGKSDPMVCAQALVNTLDFMSGDNAQEMEILAKRLIPKKDETINLYLGFVLGPWAGVSENSFFQYLKGISDQYASNPLFQEAILSGLSGSEEAYLDFLENSNEKPVDYLTEQLAATLDNKANKNENTIFKPFTHHDDSRTKGMRLYKGICAACHGVDGLGIDDLAPPLEESEYVTGSVDRLGLIILHGLHGPVHVNGKLYELNTVMPGLVNNSRMTDKDIADIISFVTSSFSRQPRGISPNKVKALRDKKPQSAGGYTEEELLGMKWD